MATNDLIDRLKVLVEKMRACREMEQEEGHGTADDIMESAVRLLAREFPRDHPVYLLVQELCAASDFPKWCA
jgi:hypothetical protein